MAELETVGIGSAGPDRPTVLDLDVLRRAQEMVAAHRPVEERWIVVVPEQLEDRARAALEANGIPTSCLRVSAVCPPDKLYLIDRQAVEEPPDA